MPEEWLYSDTLSYHFEVKDTLPAFDINLTLEHSEQFAFGNLYVLITTGFPNGQQVSNPVSLALSDNFGQWLGKCSNDWCKTTLQLSEKIYFDKAGKYSIHINQHSRKPIVEGIRAAILTVSKSKS